MKGYKAFNKDLQCRGMQYEIGGTYELEGTYELGDAPVYCERGFHFCKSISDCYKFYVRKDEVRICEVEALGEVAAYDGLDYCTDKIHVIREVENPRIKSNVNENCSGFCNSGNYDSGNWNSGNQNTGDYNGGDHNSGDCNSGHWNSGNGNCGNRNTGDWNTGDYNIGNGNSGDRNTGDCNTGNWNCGNFNSGIFNTNPMPTIKIFDKNSDWTVNDWYNSNAYRIMENCPLTHSYFIYESDMSEEEKANHPEYKTLGGYTKTIAVTAEDKQKWWNGLSDSDKQAVMSLPNFDADKFYQCTGIRV